MSSCKEYVAVLLIFGYTNVICGSVQRDKVTDETELLFSFVVHRHGDRTPVESSIFFSDDPETLAFYSKQYGYGQLTDAGKRTGYRVGEFIRRRYDKLLSLQYNRSEIYIRSTDSTRTKMTVLTEMAAVYPPGRSRWNSTINWAPVPYTTVPVKYDFNLATFNCPTLTTLLSKMSNLKPPEMLEQQYREVFDKLGSIIGYNFTENPLSIITAYDLYLSQMSLGLPLNPTIKELLPQIQKLAAMGWDFGKENFLRYHAGVLLNELYEYANLIISGEPTPKVRVYSCHDINVHTAMSIYNIPSQGVVQYGGTISLELRKVTATGKYVILLQNVGATVITCQRQFNFCILNDKVLEVEIARYVLRPFQFTRFENVCLLNWGAGLVSPVYLRDPRKPEEYLQISGCDLLCDIDQFYALTSHNALNETEWRTECGFNEDMEIDTSGID